jgi:hypothetical protein
MKIIEAMKKVKDLQRKGDDYKGKIQAHCADLDCETPIYPDQKREVASWLQGHEDIVKEILHLRCSIQLTNLKTEVTIEVGGKFVKKTIAEWIHRRRDLAKLQETLYRGLTDRGLKEQNLVQLTPGTPQQIIKRRLYFDPSERDKKIEMYRSEPSLIDATLEITNAVTELIEI